MRLCRRAASGEGAEQLRGDAQLGKRRLQQTGMAAKDNIHLGCRPMGQSSSRPGMPPRHPPTPSSEHLLTAWTHHPKPPQRGTLLAWSSFRSEGII